MIPFMRKHSYNHLFQVKEGTAEILVFDKAIDKIKKGKNTGACGCI